VCRVSISVQVASRVSQLPLRGAAVSNQGQNRPSKQQKVTSPLSRRLYQRHRPISDIQHIETIAAVFLGWLAAKPRSISSAGSEGLRDDRRHCTAFDVYPVMKRTLSFGERLQRDAPALPFYDVQDACVGDDKTDPAATPRIS
jgi:hypothetical protein